MTYKASWDNFTKIMTGVVTAVILFGMLGPFFFENIGNMNPYLVCGILLVTYVIAYLYRPIEYSLDKERLIIHRPLNNVTIERSQIARVSLLDNKDLRMTIRTFGVGGLFGYYGKFYNSKIGKMTWYATRRSNAVLIETKDQKKILLTPDEAKSFAREFKSLKVA